MNIYLLHRDRCHDCRKLLKNYGGRAGIECVDVHGDELRALELMTFYDIGLDADAGLPIVVVAWDGDHDTARGYEECDKLLKERLKE
jgi:hypothetical protein